MLPRYGSSPDPSAILPQRGSRQISTIGLKFQFIPSAVASIAEICAIRSIAVVSHEHDSANGIGKMVSYP